MFLLEQFPTSAFNNKRILLGKIKYDLTKWAADWRARLKFDLEQCQLFVYPTFVYNLLSQKLVKIHFIREAPRPSARFRHFSGLGRANCKQK